MSIQCIPLSDAPFMGQPSSAFGPFNVSPLILNGSRYVLPVGSVYIVGQSGFDLQFQTGNGTWTTVATSFPAVGSKAGFIWSDGSNVAMLNNSGHDGTFILVPIR